MKIDNEAFQKAVSHWEETAPIKLILDVPELKKHFLTQYGIVFTSWGQPPKIVDEQLYTMFLLRFS